LDCGDSINFRFPEFQYNAPGKKRVLLKMSGFELTKDWLVGCCGGCTSKRIHSLFTRIKPFRGTQSNSLNRTGTRRDVCDGCGETKTTIDISWDKQCDIRFGSAWWNGHKMCEDCLCEAAENGKQTSGISMYHNGKYYEKNEVGAVIGLMHWYDLLKPHKPKALK
jgi:hypothetical protein